MTRIIFPAGASEFHGLRQWRGGSGLKYTHDKMTDWDKRYSEGAGGSDEPHPLIVTFASKLEPGHALDVACGTGRHAIWLAERGWQVTAVDNSRAAIAILQQRAGEKGVAIDSRIADLERHEFVIEPESYDLVIVCNYLQRDLFPAIRAGTRLNGIVIAIIAMVDGDPDVKPMNPAFLLNPGELRAQFEGWELLQDYEGKPAGNPQRRKVAEIVAGKRRTLRKSDFPLLSEEGKLRHEEKVPVPKSRRRARSASAAARSLKSGDQKNAGC